MFIFIAGNHFKHAINVGKSYIKKNRKPIINFAVEEVNYTQSVYQEYKKLINNLPNSDFSIALKLSSVNFDDKILEDIVGICKEKKTKLFIDAENNYNNDKYQNISTDLMLKHNENDVIYKTYQMYRHDALTKLNQDLELCKKNNKLFCCKLVRGAYWNTEYKDGHLFTNKKDTDDSYNNGILDINNSDYHHNTKVVLATHNNVSIELGNIINRKNEVNEKDKIFEFAHLQGMSECHYNNYATSNIVHVYIPYGPYDKMLPYLSRRLYENLNVLKYIFS